MHEDYEVIEKLYPNNKYRGPSGDAPLRDVDEVALPIARIMMRMPDFEVERTSDVIEIRAGGENGIVVIVTDIRAEIRLFRYSWVSHYCVPSSKLWKELSAEEIRAFSYVEIMIMMNRALGERENSRQTCHFCKETFVPERGSETPEKGWANSSEDDIKVWACHGCMEKHLGVAF